MEPKDIRSALLSMQDAEYREFMAGVVPTIPRERIIGIRTPVLKRIATELYRNGGYDGFLEDLPHYYFEENQLHAFIISEMKDYERCIMEVNRFLPYVDNWATCDQMGPKVFRKHRMELLEQIRAWICTQHTYTIRFGIRMLMDHFLEDAYDPEYPEMVAAVRSEEYYVRMMAAWYFATALAKQYDAVLPFLEERKLGPWTHNKAIQKATESYRITPEQKAYLRNLKLARA